MRKILGALAGIAVAVFTVMLMEWISHSVYPMPADLEITDTEALNAYLAAAPVSALLLVLAGYLIATFDGTLVACLIGRTKPHIYALFIGVLMLAGSGSNLIMFQHPTWFSISTVIGIIASAWLAAKCARAILPNGADLK